MRVGAALQEAAARRLRTLLAAGLALALLPPLARAAEKCKLVDPELQRLYLGACKDGLATGYGYAYGTATYRGGFKAGKKSGYGVKTWPNGDRYAGQFRDGYKWGEGTYTWGRGPWQGERYTGHYVRDQRQGYGVYRWPSGDVYKGPWKDNRIAGPATPMMRAYAEYLKQVKKAVAKVGQKVCRRVPIGLAEHTWVRGVVVKLEGSHVVVRITDPGAPGAAVENVEVKKGSLVLTPPQGWTPCM